MSEHSQPRPPPKGILKNAVPKRVRRDSSSSETRIDWDEENLKQNEEEKVPRMKITEPKTPFMREVDGCLEPMSDYELEEDFAAHLNDGSHMMEEASSHTKLRNRTLGAEEGSSSEGKSVSADEEDSENSESEEFEPSMFEPELSEADRLRKIKFENIRKAHYNMAAALALGKSLLDHGDDDDDGEEDGEGDDSGIEGDNAIHTNNGEADDDLHGQESG